MTAVARLLSSSVGAGELAAAGDSHSVCEVVLVAEEEAASIRLPAREARCGEDPARAASAMTREFIKIDQTYCISNGTFLNAFKQFCKLKKIFLDISKRFYTFGTNFFLKTRIHEHLNKELMMNIYFSRLDHLYLTEYHLN